MKFFRAIFAVIAALSFFVAPVSLLAQGRPGATTVPIETEIIIPGQRTTDAAIDGAIAGKVSDLADYIGLIYNFLISIVGILAGVMMVIGGFQYLTSAGDKSKVDAGKKRITNALAGMILALSSFLILNTINPDLVNLKVPTIGNVNTVVTLIPLCEDLVAQKVAVTQAGRSNECGRVGIYTQGNAEQVCMFRGKPCPIHELTGINKPSGVGQAQFGSTCMPFPNVDAAATLARAKSTPGAYESKIGNCMSCLEWAWYQKPGTLTENRCLAFQSRINRDIPFNTSMWSTAQQQGLNSLNYCRYNQKDQGCYGLTFKCGPTTTSCDAYEKMEAIVGGDAKGGAVASGRGGGGIIGIFQSSNYGKLKGNPASLYDVCNANPCNYNAAGGGCKPSFGIAEISAFVRSNESGSWECEDAE